MNSQKKYLTKIMKIQFLYNKYIILLNWLNSEKVKIINIKKYIKRKLVE